MQSLSNKPSKPRNLQTNPKDEEEEGGEDAEDDADEYGEEHGEKEEETEEYGEDRMGENDDDRVTKCLGFVCVCVFVRMAFLCGPTAKYIRSLLAQHCEHRLRWLLLVDRSRLS